MGLASNAPLSIKNTSGTNRNIAQEVDGNNTGNKSLSTLGVTAGVAHTHHPPGVSILDFLGYSSAVNVTYSMSVVTPYNCTPMGIAGGSLTMSHNVTLTGLPIGNTVDVNLRFYGGMTFVDNTHSVTYSVYAYIYKNSVLQSALNYVTTGAFGPGSGAYYLLDSTKTLTGIISTDTIRVDRTFNAQQNPDGTHLGWWGSSLGTLSITNPTGVPINLIPGTVNMDLQQLCS